MYIQKRRNFNSVNLTMELRPGKCTGNITMVIKSTPMNYARRQAIRDTWASDPKFNLVFILGMHTTRDRKEGVTWSFERRLQNA